MGKGEMIGILALSCLIAIQHVTADSHPECATGQTGPQGWPGEIGLEGAKGEKGDQGENAFSVFKPPDGAPCYCPEGRKGEEGAEGRPGPKGDLGMMGYRGATGAKGDTGAAGVPGPPGEPASRASTDPPQTPNTLFVPVVITGKMPRVMCHHLRRHAYVPVVSNKFVGWYEPGKSGYLTYNKWLYFSSRFTCPCSIHLPPGPTPSPEELMRRLK